MRLIFVLSLLAALGACASGFNPGPASDDPRAAGHAAWCGSLPPSGYCIVPEGGR